MEGKEYKIHNLHTAMWRQKYTTTSDQVSETLPNETMSMAELVDRFVKGHSIPGLKNYPYDSDQPDEENLPDTGMMSKTEVAQMKLNVKETISQNEQILVNQRKTTATLKKAAIAAKKVTTEEEDPPKTT